MAHSPKETVPTRRWMQWILREAKRSDAPMPWRRADLSRARPAKEARAL